MPRTDASSIGTRADRAARIAVLAAGMLATMGCGYTLRPPYDKSIKTVYVPVVKSQRFTRDVNLQFTELLQEEIRTRTPYQVVGSPEGADATLLAVITFDDKNIQVENPNNLPRHVLLSLVATVSFTDNRTGSQSTKTTPPSIVGETAPFYGEIGETTSLGYQKVLKKMCQDIVSMMEAPWGPEYRKDIDLAPFDPETEPIKAPRSRPSASAKPKRVVIPGP